MAAAAIAEIEELIKVQEVGEGDLQVGAADGKSGEEYPPPPAEAGLDFCCKYCDKKFCNKQALGGHQNAHRMERAMEKNAKRSGRRGGFMDYGFLNPHFPFSPLARFPPLPGGGGGQVNNWYQAAAAKPPDFLPGNSILPSPEIPTGRPPYAYPFPPAVPQTSPLLSRPPGENGSPLAHVSPAPAMTVPWGNTFPRGSVPGNSPVTPSRHGSIVIYSNPMNTPEINKDGGLDLTLKL